MSCCDLRNVAGDNEEVPTTSTTNTITTRLTVRSARSVEVPSSWGQLQSDSSNSGGTSIATGIGAWYIRCIWWIQSPICSADVDSTFWSMLLLLLLLLLLFSGGLRIDFVKWCWWHWHWSWTFSSSESNRDDDCLPTTEKNRMRKKLTVFKQIKPFCLIESDCVNCTTQQQQQQRQHTSHRWPEKKDLKCWHACQTQM